MPMLTVPRHRHREEPLRSRDNDEESAATSATQRFVIASNSIKQPYPHHFDSKTRSLLKIKTIFRGEKVLSLATSSGADNDKDEVSTSTTITAVTQMNVNPTKLQRLIDLATRWEGCISVAIYVGVDDDSFALLQNYFEEHSNLFARAVVQLVSDYRPTEAEGSSGRGGPTNLYPINILRNIAIEYAPTDRIALLDVDFIPSARAHSALVKHLSLAPSNEKSVLILPAFERSISNKDEHENELLSIKALHVPETKSDLIADINEGIGSDEGKISPFHVDIFPQGHEATNYDKWYQATEPYHVDYSARFEPYFVIHKKEMPPFWDFFQGFGQNKWSWVAELSAAGWTFNVAPDCFVVHINHDYSANVSPRGVLPEVIMELVFGFMWYIKKEYGSNPIHWDDIPVIHDTLGELGYDEEDYNEQDWENSW